MNNAKRLFSLQCIITHCFPNSFNKIMKFLVNNLCTRTEPDYSEISIKICLQI